MRPDIPVYYYDEAKKRYFRIEQTHTAPASAAWSAAAVKRRRAGEAARQAARQRAQRTRGHIQRHAVGSDVVAGGLLSRQTDGGPDGADVGAAGWAAGLVDKGRVDFAAGAGGAANMGCLYVGGDDDKTGLGVAYATLDDETLVGSYVPMDDDHRIDFGRDGDGRGAWLRTEMVRCPQMSSIKYHRPSHRMLLTSREPDHSCGLYLFSPPLSAADEARPQWLLGETNHYQRLSMRHGLRDEWLVHGSTPAPGGSDLVCVVGTNAGVLCVWSNETMGWAWPARAAKGLALPREVFDQDFQQGNPSVVLAGGRQPRLWTTDLRAPEAAWSFVRHASSIAHVRSVNAHQVLVAGPESAMALYDLRFATAAARPLVAFAGYRNAAHLHTGWDVSPELGVVAAAHDDGTVQLFSLRSGRRLGGGALGGVRAAAPVKALMFQRMPGERLPSLFVGVGPALAKYSFGAAGPDDEA